MAANGSKRPIIHFVGSIPLPDAETVFGILAGAAGPYLLRLPDGETGIRKTWIRSCKMCLPRTRQSRWRRTYRRSNSSNGTARCCAKSRAFGSSRAPGPIRPRSKPAMPRWRSRPGACLSAAESRCHSRESEIPGLAPDADRANLQQHGAGGPAGAVAGAREHMIGEVEKIAAAIPNDSLAVQWDVCQEVLAWEGYYEAGPVDFRSETIDV